jgi:hypothetical protein
LLDGPVYIPEGASDTAALHSVGACAIGRAMAKGLQIREWLVRMLRNEFAGRDIVVLGDNDEKDGPGREGAFELADYLRNILDRPITWALPPTGHKDVRLQIIRGEWSKGLLMWRISNEQSV